MSKFLLLLFLPFSVQAAELEGEMILMCVEETQSENPVQVDLIKAEGGKTYLRSNLIEQPIQVRRTSLVSYKNLDGDVLLLFQKREGSILKFVLEIGATEGSPIFLNCDLP